MEVISIMVKPKVRFSPQKEYNMHDDLAGRKL